MESLQYSGSEMAAHPMLPSKSNYDLSNEHRATALAGAHYQPQSSFVRDLVTSPSGSQTAWEPLPLPRMLSNPPLPPPPSQFVEHRFDTTGQIAPHGLKPRVTASLWEDEGSLCFQVEANGVCVARREDNHMINGTKLLNVAGMTRGRRDGILKSEKTRHVVKIGPMHLKGVWIPFDRALDFANKEKITDLLYPLFVHNIGALLYHPVNQARESIGNAAAPARESRAPERTNVSGLQPDRNKLDGSSSQCKPLTPPPSFGVAQAAETSVPKQFRHQASTRPEPSKPNGASDAEVQDARSPHAASSFVGKKASLKERALRFLTGLSRPPGAFDSGYGSDGMEAEAQPFFSEDGTPAFDPMTPNPFIDNHYPSSLRSSRRIEELQSLIEELQLRTENLLKQTKIGVDFRIVRWTRQPSTERSQRSSSTPAPFSRSPKRVISNVRLRSEANRDLERYQAESPPTFGPIHSPRSDADVSYNRSRRQCTSYNDGRSQSEPPGRRHRISSCQTQGTQPSGVDSTRTVQSSRGKSSHKRNATQSFPQHGHDMGKGQRLQRTKRRKATSPNDKVVDKDRFPCIFYAGEPTQYPSHTKTYEYISQLLRHLRRHDFYACSKCFTQFEAPEDQELHTQEAPCIKSCRNRRCLRHLPSGFPRDAAHCDCILSPYDQWRHLFLMQYPDKAVPDLASFQDPDMTEDLITGDEPVSMGDLYDDAVFYSAHGPSILTGSHIASLNETIHNSFDPQGAVINESSAHASLETPLTEAMDLQFPEPFPLQLEHSDSDETLQPSENAATSVQIDNTFFNEVQRLRERVQLLEQRLSQPSDREQDLEMVLGNVWQALTRTGSSESQPESPVWRLVRRFAGGVLSSASQPSRQVPPPPPAPSAQSISASWSSWHDQLFNSQDSGSSSSNTWTFADSGYGSTASNASNKF